MRRFSLIVVFLILGGIFADRSKKTHSKYLKNDNNHQTYGSPKDDPYHHQFARASPQVQAQYLDGLRKNYGAEHWRRNAQDDLQEALARQNLNTNVAKNVIIFIGDGMGITTTTAARIHEGNARGMDGEEHYLSFEKFPYSAFSKTYNSDYQTQDSAAGATAILCGIKTTASSIGVDDGVVRWFCPSQPGHEVDAITYWAHDAGKATGVVTNVAVTHATPAAAYASTVDRSYENDATIPDNWQEYCPDIAKQLIEKGHNINVVMGGGRYNFIGSNTSDPAQPNSNGLRSDGRNLIQEWAEDKFKKGATHATVFNRQELMDVDTANTDYLFGLFSRGHMSYEITRNPNEPSVADMTEKAIEVLQHNENGYFLMVEGGRIDLAHHSTQAHAALLETQMLSKAVEVAVNKTSEDDTLIIVTADHSHVMTFGGYHFKGTNPLDKGIYNADDLRPHTKLTYGNGPGYAQDANGRGNLFGYDTTKEPFDLFQAAVPLYSETHGAEDVGIYARGPMAHLFQGVKEQHYIAHAAAYAACIGENKNHCQPTKQNMPRGAQNKAAGVQGSLLGMLALVSINILYYI